MAGTLQADFLQPQSAYGLTIQTPSGNTIATINSAGIFSNTGQQLLSYTGNVTGNIFSTGTISLPSGTANGVAYLNSSNALTTGSALTFDGTTLTSGATSGISTKLVLQGGIQTAMAIKSSTGTGGFLLGRGYASDDTNSFFLYDLAASQNRFYIDTTPNIFQYATAFAWSNSVNSTEYMRLTSTGLGIGTSSPTAKLTINGTNDQLYLRTADTNASVLSIGYAAANSVYFQSKATGTGTVMPMAWYMNNTQAMTLDTSGNLLVGQSSLSTSTVGVSITGSGYTLGTGFISATVASSTNTASNLNVYSTGALAYRFYVDMGGTVHATSTSISAISDATLKTNVKDLETGLTEVMALKPRRFDWINGDATNVAGFIAQEVEQVLPELVVDSMYNHDENGNEIKKKNLKMGDILPTLVKAIQELSAQVNTLQATVSTQSTTIATLQNRLATANIA